MRMETAVSTMRNPRTCGSHANAASTFPAAVAAVVSAANTYKLLT